MDHMVRKTGNTACQNCARPTSEPRKGLCLACYRRLQRGTLVQGPCKVCQLGDRRMLRRHRLADGWAELCGNDAQLAGQRTMTLAELVAERFPDGDRRQDDRRQEDRRAHLERRQRWSVDHELPGVDRRDDAQLGRRARDRV